MAERVFPLFRATMCVSIADYQQTDAFVSTWVTTAVSDATGRPIEELPPLYSVIDPDALDALFADTRFGQRGIQVRFSFAGCRVHIDNGAVTVTEESQREEAPSSTLPTQDR
jgi:hypothetical protein